MTRFVAAIAMVLTAAAPTPSYDWTLTPAGWGPVRIGMTRDQVEKALKVQLEGDAFDDQGSCIDLHSSNGKLAGLYFMFLDGKLSRISVVETATIRTPRGMGVGSSADEVRAAYGATLLSEPHYYDGEPAQYLTYWVKPKARGVRFETDTQRKVQTVHAGNDSIELVESCA